MFSQPSFLCNVGNRVLLVMLPTVALCETEKLAKMSSFHFHLDVPQIVADSKIARVRLEGGGLVKQHIL